MEVLEQVEDMTASQNQDDSLNSKDQALMLDELREAMNDMASLISMYTSGGAAEIATGGASSKERSNQTPTLIGEDSSAEIESEVEETLMALLASVQQAATIEELEKIHEEFTTQAQLLKGKFSQLKSRKLIEAYLSLMAMLNAVQKQITNASQQNITQINGRQIAEQLAARLMQSQQIIRNAAQRIMENTMQMAQQNAAIQINIMLANLKTMLANQPNLAQETAQRAMQELVVRLQQTQIAAQKAQEAMLRARTVEQQQQIITRLTQITNSISLQPTIANAQKQLESTLLQMQLQQQSARDAGLREQLTMQIHAIREVGNQLAPLNTAILQQQSAAQFGAATIQKPADIFPHPAVINNPAIQNKYANAGQDNQSVSKIFEHQDARVQEVAHLQETPKQTNVIIREAAQQYANHSNENLSTNITKEKPAGDIAAGGCKKNCPCGAGCQPQVVADIVKNVTQTAIQQGIVATEAAQALGSQNIKTISTTDFNAALAGSEPLPSILATQTPSANPDINGAQAAMKSVNLTQPLF